MQKLTTVKIALLEKGITSLKMAKDLNINPSSLSIYLNGWKPIPDYIKKSISYYLEVSEKELFE